jgi:hypothetical protein
MSASDGKLCVVERKDCEAYRFNGTNSQEILTWLDKFGRYENGGITVNTPGAEITANIGDWIVMALDNLSPTCMVYSNCRFNQFFDITKTAEEA